MIKNAIGLIETIGLAAGIEAADAAVKSANVKLIGYELSKGDGMCTVKVEGDVGAVKAAISAATAAAGKVSGVYSTNVIPRPAQGLENLIFTKDTVGLEKKAEAPKAAPAVKAEAPKAAEPQAEVKAEAPETAPEAETTPSETEEEESEPQADAKAEEEPKADATPEKETASKAEAAPKPKSSPKKNRNKKK